jgi:hypothetical protein
MYTRGKLIASFLLGLVMGVILTGVMLTEVLPAFSDAVGRFDRNKDYAFKQVKLSMSSVEVTALLGKPVESSTEFRLAQLDGYEFEYAAAARSGSAYFSFWHNGVDWVYAIGFDASDHVVFKAAGKS